MLYNADCILGESILEVVMDGGIIVMSIELVLIM